MFYLSCTEIFCLTDYLNQNHSRYKRIVTAILKTAFSCCVHSSLLSKFQPKQDKTHSEDSEMFWDKCVQNYQRLIRENEKKSWREVLKISL